MKTFITSLAIVALFGTFAFGAPPLNKGAVVDKTKVSDILKPAKPSPILENGTKVMDLFGLDIKQVSSRRTTKGVTVTALLQSNYSKEIVAGWTLMKLQGGNWINLRKGANVLVLAKGSKMLAIELPATNEALRFRLAVSWTRPTTNQTAKEFKLAAAPPPLTSANLPPGNSSGSAKPAVNPPQTTAKEAKLTLLSLKCYNRTEFDDDEIDVRVYTNQYRYGATTKAVMTRDQEVNLQQQTRPFHMLQTATIELWEIDSEIGGVDDNLGKLVIRVADGFGEQTVNFHGRIKDWTGNFDWSYDLRYRLDPVDP